jgi:hypothetical protein
MAPGEFTHTAELLVAIDIIGFSGFGRRPSDELGMGHDR